MKTFNGTFIFFCKPTNTADNKKTVVELTADYDLDEFIGIQKLWDETVNMSIVKEELQNIETPKSYGFQVLAPRVNKGSKDTKTYTVFLVKQFDMEEHLELDTMLYQSVYVEMREVQPDIDFDKKNNDDDDYDEADLKVREKF